MHETAIVEAPLLCVHKDWNSLTVMKWEYSPHNYSPIGEFQTLCFQSFLSGTSSEFRESLSGLGHRPIGMARMTFQLYAEHSNFGWRLWPEISYNYNNGKA